VRHGDYASRNLGLHLLPAQHVLVKNEQISIVCGGYVCQGKTVNGVWRSYSR